MQFWRGAEYLGGSSGQSDAYCTGAIGEYHGRQAYAECASVWYVPEFGQSYGGSGNGCGNGRIDTDALHSEYTCAVDRWSSNGVIGEYACVEQ
jgi:hypothetical protein